MNNGIQIPIAKPLIGQEEKKAVLAVLESVHLTQGEVTKEFESTFAEFCGARHAVATSSGTSALHVALLAHGVGPGDEVITSPFTFIASANSILFCGARPVFVDIEADTFNLDPDKIEAAITPRTKAILPVHLYGNPADMRSIEEIADRQRLEVIEDAAQAHGASISGEVVGGKNTTCFSFYPTKNMTSGEGGMVTTNNDGIADHLRLLRAHGAPARYHHTVLGYNFRMTDIQAAIGLAQLAKLSKWNEQRRSNAAHLTSLLKQHVVTPTSRRDAAHVYHQYTIRVPNGRRDFVERLAQRGIGTGVHYSCPVYRQPFYRELGYTEMLPVSERACAEVLSLPVHPSLNAGEIAYIADSVREEVDAR
jgi:dTDP-4-amino-4,6-dideoxygalactose transaminase